MDTDTELMTSSVRRGSGLREGVSHSNAFEWLARAGFLARGAIYGIIGILALKLALGSGGKTTNQQGALETIAHQPFGKVLLVLAAIGLAGYSLWRLARAALGRGREDSDSSFDRIAALGSGVIYGSLCAIAVEILLGSGESENAQKAASGVLGWPGGPWIVAIAGVALVGVGLYQAYRGFTTDFLADSKTEQMTSWVRRWISFIGRFGHLARAVVFGLVGVFLVKAAIEYDPNKAVGIDGALAKLASQSYGSFVLGLVAAGLIAFGLYSISDARFRRI